MGCDIHFRVEYFAPEETVVQTENGIEVKSSGRSSWRCAERLTENEYYGEYPNEPRMAVAHEDRFYTGRDYRLFDKLSGVRGPHSDIEPLGWGNGFPNDMSDDLREEFVDDPDLHSHTHYTLTKLLEVDWQAFDEHHRSSFYDTIVKMQVVAIEKCGGNTDRVRACFAYDN